MNTKKLFIVLFVVLLFVLLAVPSKAFAVVEITEDVIAEAVEQPGVETNGIEYSEGVGFFLASGEYKLMDDFSLSGESIMVIEDENVVVDMNGKTLTYEEPMMFQGTQYPLLLSDGSLTIKGNGKVVTNEFTFFAGAVQSNGTLVIENGTFQGMIFGGEESNITINGGTFEGISVGDFNDEVSATVKITGGTFVGKNNGGALNLQATNATITGGKFSADAASSIYYYGAGTTNLAISGGTFTSGYDNGIEIEGVDALTISGGEFTGGVSGISVAAFNSIKLSGGTFKATSDNGKGGILLIAASSEEEYTAEDLVSYLVDGYKYSPDLDAQTGEGTIYTQKEISVVSINTEEKTNESEKATENEKINEDKENTEAVEQLQILEGADQTYTEGQDLIVRASGEFDKFTGLQMDGVEVSSDNYTAVSGSTIITLKSTYLATLSAGKHTLKFLYNDGTSVETSVTVGQTETQSVAETVATTKTITPNTGDNIVVFASLFVIATISSVVLIRRKK